MFRRTRLSVCLWTVLAVANLPLPAQTVPTFPDNSTLKQVIIFGRHGVRSAALPSSTISNFASQPYPDFGVPTGYLTAHGYRAQFLLGNYFHDYLLNQGLLTGNAAVDLKNSYFRANSIQRSNISAAAFSAAMLPGMAPQVHSFALGTPDPIFDPISAKVFDAFDTDRVIREVQGIYGSGTAVQSAYAAELSLIRSVLFNYPLGTVPVPPTPQGLVDPTAGPVPLTLSTALVTSNVVNAGSIGTTLYAADPFVMEYTTGLPLDQVAWGQLSLDQISQQTRIITLLFNLELTSPYLAKVQSSNAASHILRTMEQSVDELTLPGGFGNSRSKLVVVNSSDAYVEGVAALLHAHWQLPGYQADYCAPGGSLVFELRQRRSGDAFVRVYYTAQTFNQLRNLTTLTLDQPPATMQLFVPGGSKSATNLDINFDVFQKLMNKAIGAKFVQAAASEVQPGILTGVPLQ